MRASPELACAEVEALLPLVADGAIDAEADPPLFAHLATCDRCQASLAGHDLIALALADAPAVAAPAPLRLRHHRVPLPIAVASAAAVVLAATLAWLDRATAAASPALAAKPVPEVEVIRVQQPGDGTPRFLVRDGDGAVLVDPRAVDGKHRLAPEPVVMPRD